MRVILALALALFLGALGRDRLDDWVDATVPPPLGQETSAKCRRGTAPCCAPSRWPTGAGGWPHPRQGVRAASFAWFGKEPARLTEAEAAQLVALPQASEARRPDRAPGAAREGRDRVLTRMAQAGVLDNDQVYAARREIMPVERPLPGAGPPSGGAAASGYARHPADH